MYVSYKYYYHCWNDVSWYLKNECNVGCFKNIYEDHIIPYIDDRELLITYTLCKIHIRNKKDSLKAYYYSKEMHCKYMICVFFQIKQQKKEIEKLNLKIKEQDKEILNLKVSLTVTYLSFIVKLIYMCYVSICIIVISF